MQILCSKWIVVCASGLALFFFLFFYTSLLDALRILQIVTYNLIVVCLCTQQHTEDILIIWRKLGISCFHIYFFPHWIWILFSIEVQLKAIHKYFL